MLTITRHNLSMLMEEDGSWWLVKKIGDFGGGLLGIYSKLITLQPLSSIRYTISRNVLLLNSRHKNFGHLNNMCHIQCSDLCHEKLRDLPHSVYVLSPFSASDKKTTQVISNTVYTFQVLFKLLNSLCYTISKKRYILS